MFKSVLLRRCFVSIVAKIVCLCVRVWERKIVCVCVKGFVWVVVDVSYEYDVCMRGTGW